MTALNKRDLQTFIRNCRKSYEEILTEWVQLPTVSADPACTEHIRKAASAAAGTLRSFGGRADIVRTPGHPVVLGSLDSKKEAPTLLIYNHLDVQPADPSQWKEDPFSLTIRKGRYGGRGATDDKGPALAALFAAAYAREKGIGLNYRFVWEFEEEIGSPHFENALRGRKSLASVNSVLVSDTVWVSRDKPAIPYGLRGLLTATLCLKTGDREAHSGLTGGAARNPLGELCQLVSKCYDPATGRVKIPGFYEDALAAGKKELGEFRKSGFRVSQFKRAHGLKSIRFREAGKVLEAVWARPTFEVHGIPGGYSGKGVKTIVPPAAEAKISMRLVPRQDPGKIFLLLKNFVRKQNPDILVQCEARLDPYLSSPSGEYLQAGVDAMEFGFGKRPVLIREGGSIGAVVSLNRLLKVPVVFLGLSLPEHGYHAPNEYFEWKQAQGGIAALVHYFEKISRIS